MNMKKTASARQMMFVQSVFKTPAYFLLPSVVWLGSTLTGAAQTASAEPSGNDIQQSAYKSSIAEEGIRKDADKIKAQIAALLEELKVNGLQSSSLTVLSNASTNLDFISQQDMQQVINSLQGASLTTEQQQQQQKLLAAYQGQKDISLKLKSLAGDMSSAQSQNALPLLLQGLITRQSANLRKTKALGGSDKPDSLNEQQKAQWTIIQADQNSISGEVELLLKLLQKSNAPTVANPFPEPVDPETVAARAQLKESATMASQYIQTGPFATAVQKQTSLHDSLIQMLVKVDAGIDAATRLGQAKSLLTRTQSAQKEVSNSSQQSNTNTASLIEPQYVVGDQAEIAQALIKALNVEAAQQVKVARQDMEQSATNLQQNTKEAIAAQSDSLVKLEAAQKLLDQQMAALQKKQSESLMDQLASLQKLQKDILQTEQALKATTQDQTKNIAQLAQDALPKSPAAADKLNSAVDKLQQSQPDTKKADQLLKLAAADVQKQIDALQPVADAYSKLDQTKQQLDQAQKQADDANKNLQKNDPKSTTDAAAQLMAAQDQLKKLDPSQLPPDAKQDVQQAQQDMKDSMVKALGGDKDAATADAQKGQQALEKAQKGVGQAMAALQAAPGVGTPPPGTGKGNSSQKPTYSEDGGTHSMLAGIGEGANGPAQVMGGLSTKDREGIAQNQSEKTAPEYSTQVEQYFKNLANSAQSH